MIITPLTPFPLDSNTRHAFHLEVVQQGYTGAHATHLSNIFFPPQRKGSRVSATRHTTKGSTTAKKGRTKK